jgi:transformation/transcription domain-associated protein
LCNVTLQQHFLSSNNVSKSFADILLSFLVKRMRSMSQPSPSSPTATVMLSLFRVVFGSVTLYAENASVLRPYLQRIVVEAMKLAMEVKRPSK